MIVENNTDFFKKTIDEWKIKSLEDVGELVMAEAKGNLKKPSLHRGGGMFPT